MFVLLQRVFESGPSKATPAAQYDPPGFCRKRGDGQGNGGRHAESDAGREGWPSSAVPGQRIPIHIDVLVAERTAKSTMRAFPSFQRLLHSQYLLYQQVPIPRGTGLKTGIQLCLVPILLG